jgi:hypothetical protein
VCKITGKTVLPIRQFRNSLADATTFDRLMRMELELSRDPSTAAAAGHLQIVLRKP